MELLLIRHTRTVRDTRGVLIAPGLQPMATLECPWRITMADNQRVRVPYGQPGYECLREGVYKLTQRYSPSFRRGMWYVSDPDTVTVRNTDDCMRWGIMFHPAKSASQLRGCIAVGRKHTNLEDGVDLQESRTTVGTLASSMDPDGVHRLTIMNADSFYDLLPHERRAAYV